MLMGVLNFGVIINFIGFHVINGFTTAAAVTIFTSQARARAGGILLIVRVRVRV